MKKILVLATLLFCSYSYSVLWDGQDWNRLTWEQKEDDYVVYGQMKRVYIYGIKQFPVSVCVKDEFLRMMTLEAIDKFHRSYFRWVTKRASWTVREHQYMIPPPLLFVLKCTYNQYGGYIMNVEYDYAKDDHNSLLGYRKYRYYTDRKITMSQIVIRINKHKLVDQGFDPDLMKAVIIHELAHGLGVLHNDDEGSLMYHSGIKYPTELDWTIETDSRLFYDLVEPYFILKGGNP